MKFNKIAAICKSSKIIKIYSDAARRGDSVAQWIGDGSGMYLFEGIPSITTNELLRIFDIPEGKHDAFFCEKTILPRDIDFSDGKSENEELTPLSVKIEYCGSTYSLFMDGAEIFPVNEKYLKPFAADLNYIRYRRLITKPGAFVLGINIGLALQAAIAPAFFHSDNLFTGEITKIAEAFLHMERNQPQR